MQSSPAIVSSARRCHNLLNGGKWLDNYGSWRFPSLKTVFEDVSLFGDDNKVLDKLSGKLLIDHVLGGSVCMSLLNWQTFFNWVRGLFPGLEHRSLWDLHWFWVIVLAPWTQKFFTLFIILSLRTPLLEKRFWIICFFAYWKSSSSEWKWFPIALSHFILFRQPIVFLIP